MIPHRYFRLCSKVLYDHLLDMPVGLVKKPNRFERIDSLIQRLADADEYACRKRNFLAARFFNRSQSQRRDLVRSVVVSHSGRRKAIAHVFKHPPHTRAEPSESFDIRTSHKTRVHMRQEAGLIQHQLTYAPEVR